MNEGESTSDDSNGVYPALVQSLTKMLNARCRHRAKEVNKQIVFNQKLKADKVTFEKDEQEKRSQIIREKRELAAKLEAVGEENEKLRRMGNEQKVGNEQLAKDLEELTRVHRTEVNNLERANLILRAKLEKKMKENKALQEFVDRLTEQLTKKDYILEHTEQQEKEAREEFDEQKAYLEGKMEEILSREVAVLKEIEGIVSTAIMDDLMRQERYVFLKRQCASAAAEEQVMQQKRRKQSINQTVDDRGNEMMKTIKTEEGQE